jgi:polar amino acid transport system substrate-binding protein
MRHTIADPVTGSVYGYPGWPLRFRLTAGASDAKEHVQVEPRTRNILIGGGIAAAIIVVILIVVNTGDDSATTTTVVASPTTTVAETTTSTEAAPTTTTAGSTTTIAETTTTTTEAPDECAVDNLELLTPGTLTVATGEPAFPPWVGDGSDATFDVPESKTGFEAALVYELAAVMGFGDDQVAWVRTGFDEAIAPGPKTFDFNLQQYSITAVREEVVDFSDPYYITQQSLVSLPDSSVIGATSFADLADARLGAQIGTTSLDFIENVIQPDVEASVYETNIDAIAALVAGQVDGIVVDLPTAFFMTAVQIPEQNAEGVIVARFEAPAEDQYGLLFADGNSLVGCVNEALATLRDSGTLTALEDQWLTAGGDIPTISE